MDFVQKLILLLLLSLTRVRRMRALDVNAELNTPHAVEADFEDRLSVSIRGPINVNGPISVHLDPCVALPEAPKMFFVANGICFIANLAWCGSRFVKCPLRARASEPGSPVRERTLSSSFLGTPVTERTLTSSYREGSRLIEVLANESTEGNESPAYFERMDNAL